MWRDVQGVVARSFSDEAGPLITLAAVGGTEPPDAASGPDETHVVWSHEGEIFYAPITDGTAGEPIVVDTGALASAPRVAGGDCPTVVWQTDGGDDNGQSDVYLRRAEGADCAWEPAVRVSEGATHLGAFSPSVAWDGTTAWVAWRLRTEPGGTIADDVWLRALPGGVATDPGVLVTDFEGHGKADDPALAINDDGEVLVAFADNGAGDWDVQLRRWDGFAFGPVEPLSGEESTENALSPHIATSPEGLHAVWQDQSPYDGDTIKDWDVIYLGPATP